MRAAHLATATPAVAGNIVAIEKLRCAMLWLLGCAGAFVFIEPSPYEIVGLLAMIFFLLTGITLRAQVAPLVLLLVILNIGYALAVIPIVNQSKPVIWVGISGFLSATAILYAAVTSRNTEVRLAWLLRGYLTAALIASVAGIVGYMHLYEGLSNLFLLYGRARGTFNDPNVLGAFVILPGMLLMQRVLVAGPLRALWSSLLLTIILGALLLTFSRGAWGMFVFCAMLLMAITFASSRSANERARIVAVVIVGIFLLAVALAVLLSISQVADLFKERASFEQSYDVGHMGRFGRYLMGADVALENPLGIGPLQFQRLFPEDPHNTFLNAFMSGGWLAGCAYITLSLVTTITGVRFLFVATPWRATYQAIYVTYLGIVVESAIIDIDHWRHYFLVLGVLWGLMAVTRSYLNGRATLTGEHGPDTGAPRDMVASGVKL